MEDKKSLEDFRDDEIVRFQPRPSNKSLRTVEQVIELKNAAEEKRLRKNALRLKNYKRND